MDISHLSPELQGELEMLEAIYSDGLVISQTDVENLHRLQSDEIISPSKMSSSSPMSMGSPTSSTATEQATNNNSFRTIVFLRLRKNVQIELTFPSSGYYVNDKIKLRMDVLNTPHGIDTEDLLQVMKQVQRDHNIGEGSLIISVCQSAEQHVENILTSLPSSEEEEENDDDETHHQYTMMSEGQQTSSANMMTGNNKTNSTSNCFTDHHGGTSNNNSNVIVGDNNEVYVAAGADGGEESAIWQELKKRKCVRGSNVISDRRSKFLAHAAPVSSEKEAAEIVALLRSMKSIASACHPSIWAYRFMNPQTKVMHYNCDDDGEKNGEKNIMFVLDNLKVEGWIVVVTRYYGGIQLQADRFRHIATVTRDVLIEAGAVAEQAASSSGNKKK